MLTKSDKIAKKSDSDLSDNLGREGLSFSPVLQDISYILCDIGCIEGMPPAPDFYKKSTGGGL